MTGRGELLQSLSTIPLDYRQLPLAGRLQSALILGDLAMAAVKWGNGRCRALFASRDGDVTRERPSAPCGAF